MNRDPCAPIIRGTYHARHARHVRHGWAVFAAASTGAVGCGGAAATAVWLASAPAHAVPGSADWSAWAGLQRFTSQIGAPVSTTVPAPTPADWAAWARFQESSFGASVPQPGTPGWTQFVATHRDTALGVTDSGTVATGVQNPGTPLHVPEPASVAIMAGALLAAGIVSWWRR